LDVPKAENKRPLLRQKCLDTPEEARSINASRSPSTDIGKTKIATKMRAVYDAVKALKTMQKFVPSLGKGLDSKRLSLTDVDSRNQVSTVATLNYLDVEDPEEEPVDKKEFEEFANSFGKVTQYLNVGESFGENALKKDAPRLSGILCKTNCEFLTLEKQHFDEVFGQIQKEKEDFLVSVFPNLNSFSSANFQFLVCCFKTEKYNKGTYVISEGHRGEKKAKFYVIQSGECLIEKKFLKEVNNPFNRKRRLISEYENIQLSVAGKGAIFGEEILETKDEYEYSVKVLSETVILQAMTRREFKSRFPYDFHDFVTAQYQGKKEGRDIIFENLTKDAQPKIDQYKNENLYCLKNASMANLTTKVAKQSFSKQLQREKHVESNTFPYYINIGNGGAVQGQDQGEEDETIPSYYNNSHSYREAAKLDTINEMSPTERRRTTEGDNHQERTLNSERKARGDKVRMKIDFLSKVESPPKVKNISYSKAMEDARFFAQIKSEKDQRFIKIKLAQMTGKMDQLMKEPPKLKLKHNTTELIIKKVTRKRKHYTSTLSVERTEIDSQEASKIVLPADKSITHGRRSSQKTITPGEFASLYLQKLRKGRPSITLSPLHYKPRDKSIQQPSMNDVSTAKASFFGGKSEKTISRQGSNLDLGSLNDTTTMTTTAAAKEQIGYLIRKKANVLEEGSESSKNMLPDIYSRDTSLAYLEDTPMSTAKKYILKRTNSGLSATAGMLPKLKRENFKENGMYIKLNETKEWRKKIFKKTSRGSFILDSRPDNEERYEIDGPIKIEG